jgi:diguanylate cyclase (GGDEF)-like protein
VREPRPKTNRQVRPVLLLVVYGAFLAVVGVTATAQAILISAHFSTAILNATVAADGSSVREFANDALLASDFEPPIPAARQQALTMALADLARRAGLLRIEVRSPNGMASSSSDGVGVGQRAVQTEAFRRAVGAAVDAAVVTTDEPSEAVAGPAFGEPTIREYLPLVDESGTVHGVVALWRDASPLVAALDRVRSDLLAITLAAALVAAIVLSLVFRAAQDRIRSQTVELVEATRRDALTGMLNHGALVQQLTIAVEAARVAGTALGVALVDLDNFRLLNETYGHGAGDAALLRLSRAIERSATGEIVGRYGPDEFLMVADGSSIDDLEASVHRVRAALRREELRFETSEPLPITISAGIATVPDDADSVTLLLSAAAAALAEAKASGGDAVRHGGTPTDKPADYRTFNVLQSLVFAVDTKDRYTKRHSEDVARYAVFLARRLGHDEEFLEAVRTAGLLHDVGKIGIPDALLRRPGKLSAEELEVVKQHVALGGAIVRDLTNADLVRAGVRLHHERWDGRGYLEGLAGRDIPLIGRILAVADAFSAITTSRPYRKSLPVEEALRRIGDAAGSQLDAVLVTEFINGLEHAPDAPMPGDAEQARKLWQPSRQVA